MPPGPGLASRRKRSAESAIVCRNDSVAFPVMPSGRDVRLLCKARTASCKVGQRLNRGWSTTGMTIEPPRLRIFEQPLRHHHAVHFRHRCSCPRRSRRHRRRRDSHRALRQSVGSLVSLTARASTDSLLHAFQLRVRNCKSRHGSPVRGHAHPPLQPTLIKGPNVLSTGADYVSSGPLTAAIA